MLSTKPIKELSSLNKKELSKSRTKNKKSLNITLKRPEKKQKIKQNSKD